MKDQDQISKWLNNELNAQELVTFKKTEDYHRYKEIVEQAARFQKPAFDEQKGLQLLKEKMATTKNPKVRTLNLPKIYKIAAVLTILFATGLFILLNAPETRATGYAETTKFQLPDESTVHLNALSRIKYKPKNWDNQRILKLEGEAFFEVQKGEKFTVQTDHGNISVIGTKFNVKSRSGYFEVRCYEGAVMISHAGNEIELQKGESFRALKGATTIVSSFNKSPPAWIFKESDFEAVPLKEVIAELERQFDIDIIAQNIDMNQLFTGSFSHNDKEVALKSVTVPLQIKYSIEPGRKVILYEEE